MEENLPEAGGGKQEVKSSNYPVDSSSIKTKEEKSCETEDSDSAVIPDSFLVIPDPDRESI